LLSIVMPVYNGSAYIELNVSIIRDELTAAGLPYELIVVSDGSVDATVEQVVGAGHANVRVIHYDRNMGKGYAVKAGLLAARGDVIGFVDADLDLHPSQLPNFLAALEARDLDAAIGSKRHPLSDVDYPTQRRVYSWLYQQLVRLCFRLDVRDTQVGMKIFRRALVDEVVPHLLVKRYAFDLELLAVAVDAGFHRIEEQPVQLDYRFSGTGMNRFAIAQALWDTAAVFYRVRILHYYRRRRQLLGNARRAEPQLTVTVAVVGDGDLAPTLAALSASDRLPDHIVTRHAQGGMLAAARLDILERARTDAIAFLRPGSRPGSSWLSAALAYLANPEVAAVGGPLLPSAAGSLASAGASALYESRFAAGPIAARHLPGNLRDAPTQSVDNLVMRCAAALSSEAFADAAASSDDSSVARRLTTAGRVLNVPDAAVVTHLPPLTRPLLRSVHGHARARGRRLAAGRDVPVAVLAPALLTLCIAASPLLPVAPRRVRTAAKAGGFAYLAGLALASGHAAFRRRRLDIAAAVALGAPASHIAYGTGVVRGVAEGLRRGRRASQSSS
jgi:GT2 family glycosyltransferase